MNAKLDLFLIVEMLDNMDGWEHANYSRDEIAEQADLLRTHGPELMKMLEERDG